MYKIRQYIHLSVIYTVLIYQISIKALLTCTILTFQQLKGYIRSINAYYVIIQYTQLYISGENLPV